MVTLTQLEELLHFAECGTLSGAAEKCHISQPALYRCINNHCFDCAKQAVVI